MPKIFVLRHQLAEQQAKLKANDKGGDSAASNSPPLSSSPPGGGASSGAGSGDERGSGSSGGSTNQIVQNKAPSSAVQIHSHASPPRPQIVVPEGVAPSSHPHHETVILPPGLVIQPIPAPPPPSQARQPPPAPLISGKTFPNIH